jgi:glycine/D-amino acid oxidase-like deaminating enzyme
VRLVSRTAVREVRRADAGYVPFTAKGEIAAREVVIGTNGYTDGLVPHLQRRILPVPAYVIATVPLPEGTMSRLVPRLRTVSDTQRNLWRFRPSPDGSWIIIGARPRRREADARTAARRLHAMLCEIWPELHEVPVAFCWQGNVGMSADHIPHMGVYDGMHYALAAMAAASR